MSFPPYRLVSQIALHPEFAVPSALDANLKQVGSLDGRPCTNSGAWDLRVLLQRCRPALARDRRNRDIRF